uniref:Ig-like domain-containing protein n=1 Tax=Cyprinus carpio TaxID=7962 RepID=A0A8C1YCC1_CYPCA
HLTSVSLTNKHQLTLTSMYRHHKPCSSIIDALIGREGDSVEIKCPYDEKHTEEACLRSGKCLSKEVKYLCKGKCFTKDAQNIIRSDEDHVIKPRISVKDDTELNLFTVNMTELRAEDAGKYWCAVRDDASVGGSASISCKHIRKQTRKFFCRGDQPSICIRDGARVSSNNRINGRFSLTEEPSAGVFTVKISDLRAEDSGKYWCAEESSGSFIFTELFIIIIIIIIIINQCVISGFPVTAVVSVGLILLAVCLVLVLFKIKLSSKHGETQKHTTEHLINQKFMFVGFYFLQAQEEIQVSDPESTNLYSTVQSPTNPSDGLLYAAVSFQKHEECRSDATVRFRKEETHCDYASVIASQSHSTSQMINTNYNFFFLYVCDSMHYYNYSIIAIDQL